jgi:DNA polymerase-3 subunit beta
MKITANSKDLLSPVSSVGAIIKPTNVIPICACLLFREVDGKLTITADNSEVRTCEVTEIPAENGFSVCINYDLLSKILKGLPSAPMEMLFDNNRVTITCGEAEYEIPTENADEFIRPNGTDVEKVCIVSNVEFLEAVSRVEDAVMINEFEPNFSSVHLIFQPEKMIVVGIDKNIFIEASIPCENTGAKNILIHKKAIPGIMQLLSKGDVVEIKSASGFVELTSGNFTVGAVQSNGQTPAYDSIISAAEENNDKVWSADKSVFIPALKRLLTLSHKSNRIVALLFDGNSLEMQYNDIDFAVSAKETIKVDYSGKPIQIGFNPEFLIPALENAHGEVKCKIGENNRAVLFTSENYRAVAMPFMLAPTQIKEHADKI